MIKNYINHHYEVRKDIHFSFSQLQFIISIYGNPTAADSDHSQTLSMKETVFLAFAMSIDSLVAGTFAAFLKIHILPTMLAAFLIGVAEMCIRDRFRSLCGKSPRWYIRMRPRPS